MNVAEIAVCVKAEICGWGTRLRRSPRRHSGADNAGTKPTPDAGFSLVLVIWLVGLLAVVLAGYIALVRSHVRSAAATVSAARATAGADAAINLAILDLVARRGDRVAQRRFPLDGTAMACVMPDGVIASISIRDEAGKVDLNLAGEALLRALFAGAGLGEREAAAAADAVMDYRDADDDRRPNGAEYPEYRAAGRATGPKNAALDSIEELGQVLGLTAEVLDRIRPHVTVHSGLTGVDPAAAAPGLVAMLAAGDRSGSGALLRGPTLPAHFATASTDRTYAIRVEARRAGDVRVIRAAIVELVTSRTQPYAIRRWHTATAAPGDGPTPHPVAAVLPGC